MRQLMAKFFIVALITLVLLVFVIVQMPLNHFLTAQATKLQGISLSVVEPVSIAKGDVYLQVDNHTDTWRLSYKMCGFSVWCIQLDSGLNKFVSRLHIGRGALHFIDTVFSGQSEALEAFIPDKIIAFDFTARAGRAVINDLTCPSRDFEIYDAQGTVTRLNVLGEQFDDVDINLSSKAVNGGSEKSKIVVELLGSFQGGMTLHSSSFEGEVRAPQMTKELAELMATNDAGDGWSVSGKLSCGLSV